MVVDADAADLADRQRSEAERRRTACRDAHGRGLARVESELELRAGLVEDDAQDLRGRLPVDTNVEGNEQIRARREGHGPERVAAVDPERVRPVESRRAGRDERAARGGIDARRHVDERTVLERDETSARWDRA
jgi:hypothetical protein